MAQIAPPTAGEETTKESTDQLSSTLAALALSSKERKALANTVPWKARLRILRHLLRLRVEQQQRQDEGKEEGGDERNEDVEEFIRIFMPEVNSSNQNHVIERFNEFMLICS